MALKKTRNQLIALAVKGSTFAIPCTLIVLFIAFALFPKRHVSAQDQGTPQPANLARSGPTAKRISPLRALPENVVQPNANSTTGSTVVLGFDSFACEDYVDSYYAGGLSALGTGPGPNYGITFSSNASALADYVADGLCTGSNVTNLPSPLNGVVFYSGSAATVNAPAGFTGGFSFYYAAPYYGGFVNVWSGPNATGTLLATLQLPTTGGCPNTPQYCVYSPIGISFSGTAQSIDFGGTANYIIFDNITLGTQTAINPAKGSGDPGDEPGSCQCGNPISIGNGNKYEHFEDYHTEGANKLAFDRYYNSLGDTGSHATTLGTKWRSNYDRYLRISANAVIAERADGQEVNFNLSAGAWIADSDVDMRLVQSGSGWTLTDKNDHVETYTSINSTEAVLQSASTRNGYTQTLQHNSDQSVAKVTDSYSRNLSFAYQNGLLQTVTTPDGLVLSFAYTTKGTQNVLTSVSYSTSPVTSVTYLYENTSLPTFLTGVTDENGNRYATWTYDSSGRALTSQHAGGADLTTVVYNDTNNSRTVTNALGVTDTYSFATLQGVAKVTQISRAATSTTVAATESFTYDSNGYVASKTDWNSNQTNFVNDVHGQTTSIIEGVGSPVAKTTTIAYHPTFHLPTSITTAGLTTAFSYDPTTGNLLNKTLTDTTTTTAPYATSGAVRTWTYTWSNYLLASITGPRTDLKAATALGYDSSGALISVTNAVGQQTKITQHTPGGRPQTIVDPNGVTTQLVYDPRQRLTSSTIKTTAGALKTSYGYDPAENLTSKTLPDGSALTNTYDAAHRLTQETDSLGSYIKYTLDALGDRTKTNIYKSDATLMWQSSSQFDALGRELVRTAGAGQTTTKTYDPDGGAVTVKDGVGHTTTNTFDALNRLATSTDPNGGITTPGYDAHDRIVILTDANGNTTSYIRDGFGDVIQQTSPDSGVTVVHYDPNGNLTSRTDALGIVTNQTFDALDRPLTTVYPADTAENVAYTYDQMGQGFSFGIGRMTSVTDQAGSLTRAYDERANPLTEIRVNGKTTLTTGYTYDGASRIAGMTYPDGTVLTYQRDAAGYLTSIIAKPSGATTTTKIATLTHLPFGPANAVTYGNGVAENWKFDQAYRPTNITDALSATSLQNLTYTYDAADNVHAITDVLNAANSQTLNYDPDNRLTSAVSGTGGYGSLSWTFDKVGNRQTQIQGTTTTTYGYTPGSNRLATIATSSPRVMLELPLGMNRNSGSFLARSPEPPPNFLLPSPEPIKRFSPSRSNTMLSSVLGWPMLLAGLAGVVGFRRRLLRNRLLGIIVVFALLSGGALIGCGGKNNSSTPSTPVAATPVFSPASGAFTSMQSVTLTDATAGATIYFTTDGTTPSSNSTKYTAPIPVSGTGTIEAIAVASGYTNSAIATAAYMISLPAPTPTFSLAAGTYTAVQTVTLFDTAAGTTIYYTTDGSTPTTSSTKYSTPILVSATETIKAIATGGAYSTSTVASAAYTLNLPIMITTDANGNITSIPPANSTAYATFSYNNARRLKAVTGSPTAATFVYDYAGQRFSKTDGGTPATIYSYAPGGTLIAENDNGMVTDYIYADGRPIAELQPAAIVAANQITYVVADRLGTPQLLTNSSGNTVWDTTYQPFGATGAITALVGQNLRFPGQSLDAETGFSYNLNRDYMPNIGRYLETDPVGLVAGINPYTYVSNNPEFSIDPFGLDPNPYPAWLYGTWAHGLFFDYVKTLGPQYETNTSLGGEFDGRPDVIDTLNQRLWELKPSTCETGNGRQSAIDQLNAYIESSPNPWSVGNSNQLFPGGQGVDRDGTYYDGTEYMVHFYPDPQDSSSGLVFYEIVRSESVWQQLTRPLPRGQSSSSPSFAPWGFPEWLFP